MSEQNNRQPLDPLESMIADAADDEIVTIESECVECGWTAEELVHGFADIPAATLRATQRVREHGRDHGWTSDA